MRTLQVCHKPPYPAVDGGTLAMYQITKGLVDAGHEVHVFTMVTHKHPQPKTSIPLKGVSEEYHPIDTKTKVLPAILHLVQNQSYNVARFDVPEVHEALEKCLQGNAFDLVHLESLFCTPYIKTIRKHSKAPIVYRSHNVEHAIWKQLATSESKRAKKWYLEKLADQLKDYEHEMHQEVDAVACISPIDLAYHQSKAKSVYVPMGMDLEVQPTKPRLAAYHLGSMDWQPNAEGMHWFLNKVWPLVYQSLPEAEFHFAGKNMPVEFGRYRYNNIRLHEKIDSSEAFAAQFPMLIIPLQAGSGVRIKAIEALGRGKCIVSTSKGVEGIDGIEQVAEIHDEPEAMAKAIVRLMKNPEEQRKRMEAGRALFETQFTQAKSTQKLLDLYQSLLPE